MFIVWLNISLFGYAVACHVFIKDKNIEIPGNQIKGTIKTHNPKDEIIT